MPTQTVTGLTPSSTYDFQVYAFNGAGNGPVSSPPVVASTTAVATSSANFTVSGGQFRDLAGNMFVPKGVNVGHDEMGTSAGSTNSQGAQPISSLFPGINCVRLNTGLASGSPSNGSGLPYDNSVYLSFLQNMTGYTRQSNGSWVSTSSNHIVVMMEDHDGNSSFFPGTAEALKNFTDEYTGWASYVKGNPYVWFMTLNEMGSSDGSYSTSAIGAMSGVHQAIYNAIRGTGNNTILMINMGVGGSNPSTVGANAGFIPSVYAPMTGIGWELHWYPGSDNTQALAYTDLLGAVSTGGGGSGGSNVAAARTINSADGVCPIIYGEWGASSGDNSGGSTGGMTLAIIQIRPLGVGATGWQFGHGSTSEGWDMTINNGGATSLSGWGQQNAQVCAAP